MLKGDIMKIVKKEGISQKQFKTVNKFYKGGYVYTLKISNDDTIVIYKEDLYTNFFERQEFIIDSKIIMTKEEKGE